MLKMSVETITPEIAKEYLKKNVRNYRKLSRKTMRDYAEDIQSGRWELNGEPIVFDSDGYLKNGQHRLGAVILADTPMETVVVRGVENGINIYDLGSKRTISQIVSADEKVDCNSTVASAANLIVNNFKAPKAKGLTIQYIKDHYEELERAYRVTCYGGDIRSKCAPCVAASYLALRTDAIPSYELELFFRCFNAYGNGQSSGYDQSSCRIARKMFEDRGKNKGGYQMQKEKLEISVLGLLDFHQKKHRETDFLIEEPFSFTEWMNHVRREDGLPV